MAVRFSGTGQHYSRALALGTQANYTISLWGKFSATPTVNDIGFVSVGAGTGSDFGVMMGVINTTNVVFCDEFTRSSATSLTSGVWYYIGMSVAAGTGTAVIRAQSATTFTTVTWSSGFSSNVDMETLLIGADEFNNGWLNGCVCAVKVWTATLTALELQQESLQYVPVRTDQLQGWYPLILPETTDYSGNGMTLSGGAGASQEDGPGIAWRSQGRATTDAVIRATVLAVGGYATAIPNLAVDGTPVSYLVTASPNADATFGMTVSGVTTSDVVPAGTESTITTGATVPGDVTFAGLQTDDSGV